ncbi:MAG TPA: AMP-binding protein [Acidimicrobiales bacterium]|jgi:fatty-acyl-CoA synthase|nr:AMP-binding protein [Acidimicrobiales bacterium]
MEMHYATIWEAVADTVPEAVAFVQGDVRRTWAQFDDRAARLAGALAAAGVGQGAKVGQFLYNSPEFMEAYFAALKIRAVPFNVNYRYMDAELLYLLDNADAEAVVFHSSLGDRMRAIKDQLPKLKVLVEVDDGGDHVAGTEPYEALLTRHQPMARMERGPDDITMIYTGGTTGMPKGVMSSIGSTVTELLTTAPTMFGERSAQSGDDAVNLAARTNGEGRQFVTIPAPPLMHNTALGVGANPTLLFGGRIVLLNGRKFDAAELWDVAERERATTVIVVGDAFARPLLKALDEKPNRDLASVTLIASSGAMFSNEVKNGLIDHLPQVTILDLIAASEGSMGLSLASKGRPAQTGKFLPWPGVIVITEDGRRVAPGSGEEGMVALPGGALGYFKDAQKTATTFRTIDGVRYTIPGDFATVEADGSLSLLGRGSQCINTAGEKVFPEEVEEIMKTHPGVEDCLVFGLPDERFGQTVAAVVSLVDGSHPVSADDLMASARTRLASYKLPRRIVVVEIVPRIASGKADYPEAKRLFELATA